MRRIAPVVLVASVAFGAFGAADALGPTSIPVAGAVELHGEVPQQGPAATGFFVVPPPVIDVRPTDDSWPARIHQDDPDDGDTDDASELDGDHSEDDPDDADDGGADDLDDSDDTADDPDDDDDD